MLRIVVIFGAYWIGFSLILGISSFGFAQGVDTEPNNSCHQAQDLGELILPFFDITGRLDHNFDDPNDPEGEADLDAFKMTGVPHTLLGIEFNGNFEITVAFYDANCLPIRANRDPGDDEVYQVTIPSDGIIVLSVTTDECICPTSDHRYEIDIINALATHGGIQGRVVDATTSAPLASGPDPSTSIEASITVELLRCINTFCVLEMGQVQTDSAGQFSLGTENASERFPPGDYQLLVTGTFRLDGGGADSLPVQRYQQHRTEILTLEEGNLLEIGDIALERLPIWFSDLQACGPIPPAGGTCDFSITAMNNSPEPFDGVAWSQVTVNQNITAPLAISTFPVGLATSDASIRQVLALAPGASQSLAFSFAVPGNIPEEATIRVNIFAGENPNPGFNLAGSQALPDVVRQSAASIK